MTVQELITGKLARMLAGTVPVLTGLEAVNAAVNVIGLELVRRKSDLSMQKISLSYSKEAISQTLPDGFMGFVGHPGIAEDEIMAVVPDLNTALGLRGIPGTPEYYDVVGDQLFLYPEPATACTVTALAKLVPLLEMSDDLPWLGLFNDLLAVAAVQLSQQGLALLAAPAFLAMIDKGVSAVLVPRQNPLPRRRPTQFF